jgi:hypothetical protein
MSRQQHDGISEQLKAAKHRGDDAMALQSAGRWRGGMYLGGYSVECLLKSKLMGRFGCRNLRELETELQRRGSITAGASVFTHQLEVLLSLSQSMDRLRQNQSAWQQFNFVNRWTPAWRYGAAYHCRSA